jgi:hypothetical protein
MDKGKHMTMGNAPIKENYDTLYKSYLASLNDRSRDFLRYSQTPKYYQYKMQAVDGITYDIIPILHGVLAPKGFHNVRDNLKDISEYKKDGVEYIIVSSYYYRAYFHAIKIISKPPAYIKKYYSFYKNLPNNCILLKQFVPNTEHPGPVIKVYRLMSDSLPVNS